LDVAQGSHPRKHLPITLSRRGEAAGSKNPFLLVDNRGDMQILVGVHATDDATRHRCFPVHYQPPGSTVPQRLRQDRLHGQDSNATDWSGPSWVTGIGEAKHHH
jgi:hypothetical protein